MSYILKENESMNDIISKLKMNFELLKDIAPMAYWYEYIKEDGHISSIHFSSQMRKMLGYEGLEDFPDSLNSIIDNTHPDDYHIMFDGALAAVKGKAPKYDAKYRIKTASGDYMWCNATGNPVKTQDGTIVGMYGAFIDITEEIELQKKQIIEKEKNRVIDSFAKQYDAAFIGNLRSKGYKSLLNKEVVAQKTEQNQTFGGAMKLYADNFVHPDDIEKFSKNLYTAEGIRNIVGVGESYGFEYRSKTTGGYQWYNGLVSRITENDVLVGFKNCHNEILIKHITDKLLDEYDALYVVDLDNITIYPLKASRVDKIGVFKEKMNYTDIAMQFSKSVSPKYREDWINFSDIKYLKKYMSNLDHREYIYELQKAENQMRRLTIDVLDRAEGDAKTLLMSFVEIDDARAKALYLQHRMEEQGVFTSYFLEPYESAYYIGLDDLSCQVFRQTEKLQGLYPKIDNYLQLLVDFIDKDVHPDDREEFKRIIQPEYMRERLANEIDYSFNYRQFTKKGEKVFKFHVIKGVDKNHVALGFVDITEEILKQKEQKKQLEEALAMAQSANKAKTVFLNNMSHDIRTPMNAIIGYAGLAASHIENKDQVQNYLNKIGQSSNHLLSLINDVLDMSRIESGKMHLNEKEENLPDIIHTIRDIVQADIHSKQLDFYIDTVDVQNETVFCDKLRLNQVLLNILSNAIKYTPTGGTVTMRVAQKSITESGYGEFVFTIKDNGMGMSEEFVEHIFDPFERVMSSTVSGIQGSGLGMAIAKNIIDMMSGDIDIISELGKGTEVKVSFKFKLHNGPKEVFDLEELKGVRALVVDDDSNTCLSICGMLEDVGMRHEWCASGKEAIIRAKAAYKKGNSFKVYVIDWLMPDMNGIETTRRIRQVIGDEVPIIILTAYDWSDVEEEAREAGVTAFVSKPMFPSDLHRVLNQCINNNCENEENENIRYDFTGRKVLLVEDNEVNRDIANELLTDYGFIVDTAIDGHIAVEKMKSAQTGDYDLVLMDIQMPTMNGYEATQAIRALGTEISKIPIIAMTANAFDEDKRKALESGMDEHLSKPIDIKIFFETLNRFL